MLCTHILKQLRNKLKVHNAITTHADKGKTIVIIYTNEYDDKI
jgi:ribosomal protein L13